MGRSDVFYLGLDLGTSALKGVIIDAAMNIKAQNQIPAPLYSPQDSWFEMDGIQYFHEVCRLIRSLVDRMPTGNSGIAAIASVSASGSTLLADAQGRPVTPIISWLDNRMKGKLKQYIPALDTETVHEITGWPYLEGFPLAHLAWFRRHMPMEYQRSVAVCMNTEYINFQLTGRWGTDPSTVTPFYLVDQKKQKYHMPYLEMLDLPQEKLPPIMPSRTVLGTLIAEAANDTGLLPGTSVMLGSYDHPACAKGAGVLKPGQILISCGTSWAGFYPLYDRSQAISAKFLVDPFYDPDGPWGGVLPLSGFGQIIDERINTHIRSGSDKYEVFERVAAKSGQLPDELRFDLTDPDECRRQWTGKEKSVIARSIMESSCWMLKKRMEEAETFGIKAREFYVSGGPSNISLWSQIMANTLKVSIKCVHGVYTGAVGAALMAAIGIGIYKDEASFWENHDHSFIEYIPDIPEC